VDRRCDPNCGHLPDAAHGIYKDFGNLPRQKKWGQFRLSPIYPPFANCAKDGAPSVPCLPAIKSPGHPPPSIIGARGLFEMFGDMLNETLTLKKATTGHLHNFRASVQPSRSLIFTDDGQLPIEDGDTIERPRPNCVEFYTVVDAGYREAVHGIPAHFQMKVRKVTKPVEPVAPKQAVTPASGTAREDSRRTRLRQLLDDLDKLRLCGPSDDPDEQTSVIESYRYLLINVKAISKGLMPTDVMVQLGDVPSKIETIYDVYESKAHLDAVTVDLRTELEFPTTSDGPAGTTSFVSPSLIEDMRKAKNQSFDVTKLTGYCTELN
jgi:hypothetical protein